METGSSRLLFFLPCVLVINLVNLTIAQPDILYHFCISDEGNYTANSTFQANLNALLSSVSSNSEINYGFYNFSAGQNSDKVNAIALCRGDVKPDDCRSCINDSRHELTQLCPNQKQAIGGYDNCMLRYSNRAIFGKSEVFPRHYISNVQDSSRVDQFNQTLWTLLDSLKIKAKSGGSHRKFATGKTSAPDFKTLHALVQCTPDLKELACNDCLDTITGEISNCCNGKEGARIFAPSCTLRFEIFPFYDPAVDELKLPSPAPLQSPPPPSSNSSGIPTSGKEDNTSPTVIIIFVVFSVAFVVLIISICIFFKVKKSKKKVESEAVDEIIRAESLQFDFNTVRVATDNFSDVNKLGQGGFGAVYKGRLSDGQEIAVKRLSSGSRQGELEFKNEVLLVAQLQHRNLVRLLGFSLQGSERLLIYEFVPNTSLDHFIFDPLKRAQLDWEIRYKIIRGIARGLLYLHEDSRLRIIHRDLKASNVLLDVEMNPKIADFGMAKLFELDETQGNTSRIVGTYGYMAPEYVIHGQFSVKSDVFSFGVLILEIVSGQRNNRFRTGENTEHLLSFAWKNWREETTTNLIDLTLSSSSRTEMMRCIHIGLLCVQETVANRPTMASVDLMLKSYSLTLPVPSEPAFFMNSTIPDMSSSISYNSRYSEANQSKGGSVLLSANEVSITDPNPR